MDLHTNNNKIFGVAEGVSYGQQERVDELNVRINQRYFPDSPLQPNFDPRPVQTKYSLFPVINRRKSTIEPIIPYLDYNQSINFNPGTHQAPPSGFLNNIDTNSILRNQGFALQRGCDQSTYIPSTNSELYKVGMPVSNSRQEKQPHPSLFNKQQFDQTPHPNVQGTNIGRDRFFNHTRTQLRGE